MKLIKYITLEEFKKILKAEKDKRYRLAYVLAFGSGLRLSEVLGLKTKESTKIDKKTGQTVIVPSRQIPALIAECVELQSHTIRLIGAKGNKDRITVTSPWLNETAIKMLPLKLKRRNLEYRIKKIGMKVLNKDICFHTLRHGFGNYMANEKNYPLPYLQSLLGHSRLDTTGIYTKANPKQAIDKAWDVWG